MVDPLCIICTPGLCVHGEQSVTPEELEVDRLKAELAREKALHIETSTRLNRSLKSESAANRIKFQAEQALARAESVACGWAFDLGRELTDDLEWQQRGATNCLLDEREACAKVADDVERLSADPVNRYFGRAIAAAIRARGGR